MKAPPPPPSEMYETFLLLSVQVSTVHVPVSDGCSLLMNSRYCAGVSVVQRQSGAKLSSCTDRQIL